MKEIKIILKSYMLRKSVTNEQLAKRLGITPRTLQRWLNAPDQWRLGELIGAYEYLGVPKCERRFE